MKVSYDRHKSLGYLAGLASRLMSNTLGKRFQQAGIDMTAEQWGAILVLAGGDALTQGKIGEKLFLEKSSVSRLADGLERRGWIVRTRDPDDSRSKLLSLTPNAVETAERCAVIAREVLEDAQRGMTLEERFVCRSLLARVIANLEGSAV